MSIGTQRDYINKLIANTGFDVDVYTVESTGGYYYQMCGEGDNRFYVIHVSNKRLSWATKLTIRHEIGHVVMNEEWIKSFKNISRLTITPTERVPIPLLWKIEEIRRRRKLFCFLERFYYWNPILRRIKIALGFSSKIDYGPDDCAYRERGYFITRADSELFADWFAVYGWKERTWRKI